MRVCALLITVAGMAIFGSERSARGDWLYFARGGAVELPTSVRGTVVAVETLGGVKSFPIHAFRSIVAAPSPANEWRDRRQAAERDNSARAWFEAAWWGLEQGLTPEAIEALRAAESVHGAADVAPLLRTSRMLARLDEPAGQPDLASLRAYLDGTNWTELSGRHVLLLYQAGTAGAYADARERLDVLDRVVATFYLSLAAQGVELTIPPRRLVSVWFSTQADYVALLRRIEASSFVSTQGYYHPTSGIVFAFDTRTDPYQAQARRALDRKEREPSISDSERSDIERQSLLLDLRWRSVDLGIAAHETVHQLVAASGLAPRFDDFPNWLHEGFAAQFEVVRGGRWAGFGRTNDHRIADWRTIRPDPRLASLLRDEGLTRGYRRDLYAESWALVYFLRKTRPRGFVTFLDLLQAPRPSTRGNSSEDFFIAAFGPDLDRLERDWQRFLAEQFTPLEAHARKVLDAKYR